MLLLQQDVVIVYLLGHATHDLVLFGELLELLKVRLLLQVSMLVLLFKDDDPLI